MILGGKLDVKGRENLFFGLHRYFQWKRNQEIVPPLFKFLNTSLYSSCNSKPLSYVCPSRGLNQCLMFYKQDVAIQIAFSDQKNVKNENLLGRRCKALCTIASFIFFVLHFVLRHCFLIDAFVILLQKKIVTRSSYAIHDNHRIIFFESGEDLTRASNKKTAIARKESQQRPIPRLRYLEQFQHV